MRECCASFQNTMALMIRSIFNFYPEDAQEHLKFFVRAPVFPFHQVVPIIFSLFSCRVRDSDRISPLTTLGKVSKPDCFRLLSNRLSVPWWSEQPAHSKSLSSSLLMGQGWLQVGGSTVALSPAFRPQSLPWIWLSCRWLLAFLKEKIAFGKLQTSKKWGHTFLLFVNLL